MHYSFYTADSKIDSKDLAALDSESKQTPEFKLTKIDYGNTTYASSPFPTQNPVARARGFLEKKIGKEKAAELFSQSDNTFYASWVLHSQLWPVDRPRYFTVLARFQNEVVGVVTGEILSRKAKGLIIELTYVEVNPRWRGKKQCVSLVEAALKHVLKHFPTVDQILIVNASQADGAIPACFCYSKAGTKLGLKLFKEGTCLTSPSGPMIYQRPTSQEPLYVELPPFMNVTK
jgi:hypothetical protein